MSAEKPSTTEDRLVGPPRCGKVLRVNGASFSMLDDGDYPCTLPVGHTPTDKHAAVVRWSEKRPEKRR